MAVEFDPHDFLHLKLVESLDLSEWMDRDGNLTVREVVMNPNMRDVGILSVKGNIIVEPGNETLPVIFCADAWAFSARQRFTRPSNDAPTVSE